MVKYKYTGLREKLFLHPGVSSGSLTELFKPSELEEQLKQFIGQSVVAIYNQEHVQAGNTPLKNNLIECMFYGGIPSDVNRDCFSFEKSLALPLDLLLDVIPLSDLKTSRREYKRFTFESMMYGLSSTLSPDAVNAYLKVLREQEQSSLQLQLKSVSKWDPRKEDKISLNVSKSEFSKDIHVSKGYTGYVD